MQFKKIIGVLLLAAVLAVLTGCTSNKKEVGAVGYPMTITDNTGAKVVLEKEPETIVSLSPVITEIVAALGDADKLVGRTSWCDYPKEVKKVPEIGDTMTFNVEKIVGLAPDLVIGSTYLDQGVRDQLENAGIKVVTIYTEDSFEGTYKDISEIGRILNRDDEAKDIVAGMKKKIESIKKVIAGAKTEPLVYVVVGFGAGGEFTATGDTFINDMIQMAGGRNIAEDGKQWSFSLEKIVERNPEIIIYSEILNKDELKSSNGYKDLDSVKADKVYPIESNLLERTGPRLADGLLELARIIHPELYR